MKCLPGRQGANKVFTGRCVYKDDFDAALGPTRYDPTTLVVVAAPREIGREWRLVVAGEKVIAASQYVEEGSKRVEGECPSEVIVFAEAMLAEVRWRPDPIFMMDVAESGGRLWLVEMGGFSCCWLYACDLRAVVDAAGDLAIRERATKTN